MSKIIQEEVAKENFKEINAVWNVKQSMLAHRRKN